MERGKKMKNIKKILLCSLVIASLLVIYKPCGGPGGVSPLLTTLTYNLK